MSWANIALLSTAILAVVNILDSYLITKRMPSVWAFLVPVSILAIIYGSVLLSIYPLPSDVGTAPILVAVASSFLRALGILLLLYVLRIEDVSKVIPVVHTYPVFVAVMAMPLLGETLSVASWMAIIITVAGVGLISYEWESRGYRAWLSKPIGLSLLAALLIAGANLTSKYALDDLSFWNMYALGAFAMAFVFLATSLRPKTIRELRNMQRRGSTLPLLLFNETLAPVGAILLFLAIERGEVSLVSGISGAQPVFVFVYALVLSRLAPAMLRQKMGGKTAAMRFLAVALIFTGITIIHIN